MPKYLYKCVECEHKFEVVHSMSERHNLCEKCDNNTLIRIPSIFSKASKPSAGKVVREHIEESIKDLKQEKEKIKREMYHDD